MDAVRWKQVQDLFHEAVALHPDDRQSFVRDTLAKDFAAGTELERLLEEDQRASANWEIELASIARGGALVEDEVVPAEDVGQYRFVRQLGQGGMGTVYEAEHRSTGQKVAVKVLRMGELSRASRDRFATEQRALARLNHPSIARLYTSESFRDGTPCFVMEYVDGEALTEYCRNRNCPIRERIMLFRQVCEAVRHAHEHGIIHRDLKPSNVLAKKDGTIRLLDFGIAKRLDSEQSVTISGASPAPMTLAYAAPEQIGGRPAGTHTDIYALGAMLYELLTGTSPLDLTGMTLGAIETAICHQIPKPPSRVAVEQDGVRASPRTDWKDLDVLCLTALQKDPARRYRSVDALIRDLDHWLCREPLDARKDQAWYTFCKFAQRNWRALSLAASIIVLTTAGTVWFTWNLARARDEAVHQQNRTNRVEQFVKSLFQNGDSAVGLRRDTTAFDILNRGQKGAEALKSEPEFQMELYSLLGTLYQNLGRLDEADRLLLKVATNRSAQNSQSAQAAMSLVDLSSLRADQSKLSEAGDLARKALAKLRNNTNSTPHDIASAESAVGRVFLMERNARESKPLYQDALRLQMQSGALESEQADTFNMLAQAEQEAGNYPEAVVLAERALAIHRKAYGDFHLSTALDFQTLGAIRQMQFHIPEAETEYRKALRIFEDWYGAENPKTIETKIVLGQALVYDRKYAEARHLLTEGLESGTRVLGPKNQNVSLALSALGTMEQNLGNYNAARAYFQSALSAARTVWGDNTEVVATATANWATVENKAGNYIRAEHLYRNSLDTFRKLNSNPENTAMVQVNLGNALFNQGRYSEAAKELQEAINVLSARPDKRPGVLEKANRKLLDAKRLSQAKSKSARSPNSSRPPKTTDRY